MTVLLLGLDHRSLPLSTLEACWLSPLAVRLSLAELSAMDRGLRSCLPELPAAVGFEAVILSTCSRLEFYVSAPPEAGELLLQSWYRGLQQQTPVDLAPHRFLLREHAAVEHLVRVASGQEAGACEPYILEQLGGALEIARGCGTEGAVLSALFGLATESARRRFASAPGDGTVRARAAIRLLCHVESETVSRKILIVGAGRMARLAAHALLDGRDHALAFTNRTEHRAEALARHMRAQVYPWYQMRAALAWADIVIMASAALHPILDAYDLAAVLPQRRGRRLLLLDLGLPRNVDVAARSIETVSYHDLRDWQSALRDPSAGAVEVGAAPSPELTPR